MKGNNGDRHYTVVIPTRERSDTLVHTLRTCVLQDYDKLEILVSDNFSQDRTREVVESFKDNRIRYINTGKHLSMTENFEFALSHVMPMGYIIYIGDDDGLLPNAIGDINGVIINTGASVLRWDVPAYYWPTIEHGSANSLFIPSLRSCTNRRDSATTIQNVLSFKKGYASLPVMYLFSAVEYEVTRRIKNSSGKFYHSCTPDIYSGFAIAGTVDNFFDSRRPYTIAGTSHHSTGGSGIGIASPKAAMKFFSEDNLPFHSGMVICRNITAATIECFFQARDHLPFSRDYTLDMEDVLSTMMMEAAPREPDVYKEIKDAVLRIGEIHNLSKEAQQAIAANPNMAPGSGRKFTVRNLGRVGRFVKRFFLEDLCNASFYVDCAPFAVKNIFDASLLCHNILKLTDINYIGLSTVLKSSMANMKRLITSGKK